VRRIDVLTLGLAAPSRWNPLYRWWARRTTEANLTAGLKAMLLAFAPEDGLVFTREELDAAASWGGMMAPAADEGGVRYRIVDEPPPRRPRILWGQRA